MLMDETVVPLPSHHLFLSRNFLISPFNYLSHYTLFPS